MFFFFIIFLVCCTGRVWAGQFYPPAQGVADYHDHIHKNKKNNMAFFGGLHVVVLNVLHICQILRTEINDHAVKVAQRYSSSQAFNDRHQCRSRGRVRI